VTALGLSLALAALGAAAAPEVHISLAGHPGETPTITLALPSFIAEDTQRGADALLAKQLRDIVRDDLLSSRSFTVLEDGPHFDGANLKDIVPQWKTRLANCLLVAKVGAPLSAAGKLSISAQLVDIGTGEIQAGTVDVAVEAAPPAPAAKPTPK